ncbi:MAG: hypothetical protein IJ498_03045 [Akkermansia sp.]|nr:hypothetical protein [Akkermansia sp.]
MKKARLCGLMKTGCAGVKKKCLSGISAKTTRSAGWYEMHHLFLWNRFSPARSAFSRKATALFSQLPSGSFFI